VAARASLGKSDPAERRVETRAPGGNEERLTSRPAPEPRPRAQAAATATPAATPAPSRTASLKPPSKPRKAERLAPPPRPSPALDELPPRGGSVSDRIRKLSGKAYDVYRQLFLEGVRADIHRILLASKARRLRLFDDSANEAEDIVYAFLSAHYSDPYMDWEASPEKSKVEALGFVLPSLDPIIESWYRRI
jgi:hypothetical protein